VQGRDGHVGFHVRKDVAPLKRQGGRNVGRLRLCVYTSV
jgi:hypothetical protein